MVLRRTWAVVFLFILVIPLVSGALMAAPVAQMGPTGSKERLQQGIEMRRGSGMYGLGFMQSGNTWLGEYVHFEIGADGAVINYSVGGSPIFDSVAFDDFQYEESITTGTVTEIVGADSTQIIRLHDNPSGTITLVAITEARATFDLPEGEKVKPKKFKGGVGIESEEMVVYILSLNDVGANVSVTSEKDKVIAELPAGSMVMVRTGAVNLPMGRGHFRNDWLSANKEIATDIVEGRFGGEIAIGNQSTYSSVNYSTEIACWADQFERDRLRIRVSATNRTGTLVGINFDNRSFDIGDPDRLQVRLNDQPVNRTDELKRLSREADSPQCWWLAQDNSVQMVCNIPHFSEQVITIEPGEPPEVTQTPGPQPSPVSTPMVPSSVTPPVSPAEPSTPTPQPAGFDVLCALAGLLVIAYSVRRRG